MNNFVVDPESVEETEEGVTIKVYALTGMVSFPSELTIDGYRWDYVGGGFLTMAEANMYDSKATYKLRVNSEGREEGTEFQLY